MDRMHRIKPLVVVELQMCSPNSDLCEIIQKLE
jgi:hypothetical protein